MPVEVGVWRTADGGVEEVEFSKLEAEDVLEEALISRPEMVDPEMMIIDSQVATDYGKYIDVLGIDSEGNLQIVELKRDRTPRDVVAQVLDYASWVQDLGYSDVKALYEEGSDQEFETSFADIFGQSPPEELNKEHELTIVASELDDSTERIITYLSDNYGVPINAIFFRYFRENGDGYFVRSWLIDPKRAEESKERAKRSKREPWNGRDYYVSFGDGSNRDWDDAREYGFIGAGQGRWYSRTLESLSQGDRVFVHIPQVGYVGAGEVVEEVVPVTEFDVEVDGENQNILEAPHEAPRMDENAGDPDDQEYMVRVEWLDTRERENAIWKKGMFANQNTVCRLRNSFTINALEEELDIDATE
jgi:ribulose bisphosphate carboxylase small subunit